MIRYPEYRKSSTKNPKSAVQNPVEIQAKSTPNRTQRVSSTRVPPPWGSRADMYDAARMEGTTIRRRKSQRRQSAENRQAGRASGVRVITSVPPRIAGAFR